MYNDHRRDVVSAVLGTEAPQHPREHRALWNHATDGVMICSFNALGCMFAAGCFAQQVWAADELNYLFPGLIAGSTPVARKVRNWLKDLLPSSTSSLHLRIARPPVGEQRPCRCGCRRRVDGVAEIDLGRRGSDNGTVAMAVKSCPPPCFGHWLIPRTLR
eukprot:TRINITY_DN3145_c0_g1_i4.p1 TRINITY_DN3145_c0_g1~~TRINITY_DN3145_c0_g1_i4.p1  ORF type:complete len:160 (-),score=14.86 TRINITY_DN3145_c0_g1_i4:161-640(-)